MKLGARQLICHGIEGLVPWPKESSLTKTAVGLQAQIRAVAHSATVAWQPDSISTALLVMLSADLTAVTGSSTHRDVAGVDDHVVDLHGGVLG